MCQASHAASTATLQMQSELKGLYLNLCVLGIELDIVKHFIALPVKF